MPWRPNSENDYGSTEVHHFTIPQTDIVLLAFYPGGGVIKVQKSLDGGNTWGAAVTIDSTTGDNDVMLNEPWAYDPVTGRAGLCYGRFIDSGGGDAQLCFRYSDDANSASTTVTTWSAEHVIDDGTAHGSDRFYRVGLWMYNGRLSVHYTNESDTTFVTDGLWRCLASYTAGGAISWGSPTTVYTGTVVMAVEPNCHGFSDGTVIVSWYDPGVVVNQSGDLWVSRSLDFGATWDSSATKITTTSDYGRPRIKGENGNWWLVANKPWDKETSSIYADVYTLNSTDNGVTWGTPTLQFSHTGTRSLSHPDVQVLGEFVGLLTNDTNLGGHIFKSSIDKGSTWSSTINPFGDSSNSDAPRLLISKNYLIATGYDQNTSKSMYTMNADFFSIIPQVQTSVIDNFNRTDENPLSNGGKWTQGSVVVGTTGNALKLVSSAAHRQQSAGTFDRSASYRNDATYANNVEVWVTVSVLGGETNLGLGDPSTKNGYFMGSLDTDFYTGNGLTLTRSDTGTGTTLGLSGADGGAQAGDKICLQIIGTEIAVWQYRSSTWTEKFRVYDNTYRASLRASMDIAGNTNAGDTADDFGGGMVSAPTNSAVPALSGTVTVGNVLTCDGGTWSNSPCNQLSYQWQSSPDGSTWTNIPNATLSKYTIAGGDATKQLRCAVTAYNPVGSSTTNSASSGTVPGGVAVSELIGAVPI